MPLFTQRDTKRERGEEERSYVYIYMCVCGWVGVFPKGLWVHWYQLPRSSVCPRFYFDPPLPSFSRALAAAYSTPRSIIARVKDLRFAFAFSKSVYTLLQ